MINIWLHNALSFAKTPPRPLTAEEVNALVGTIISRYTEPTEDNRRLWEHFRGDVGLRRSDGWSLICDYPEPSPILLFEEHGQFEGYEFSSPADMRSVLAEAPGFEFYVTSKNLDFVLCFNHHNYIICVGACKLWISSVGVE